jgi:hypothetical protein
MERRPSSKKGLFPGKNLPILGGMAKQVLGRNLEELLEAGVQRANSPFAAKSAPANSGVRSLMRGHPSATPEATKTKSTVPVWYLFCGDILLAALALVIVCKSPHPLSWQKELFCAAAVVLGGCLALGAVLLEDGDKG